MSTTMIPTNDFLIVALDFDNSKTALDLTAKLPQVNFYKIGMELFYSEGSSIVHKIKQSGKKVFLDLKINDIPKTIEKTIRTLANMEVDYVTVFCNADGVAAARHASEGTSTRILNVTVLTSESTTSDLVLSRAKMSYQAGAHGVICSGLETLQIRQEILDDQFVIVNPGIRLAAANDDQVRTVTALEALRFGATHIVVGRPITQSAIPGQVVDNIFQTCGISQFGV